ncbi:genetic competence negative regulator [Paenactinomyces guangxiensis]|uniref:Genetic competence negative regulator n=1 Tax=Paenactinomyces guangxiensis TaxID=1490290 RepID=A0A7W2A9W8_9BACL|nr:genetic competence negative regulator [Paenactinomyces guangxiensis]MBA4495632.1 genetic competence negative regulator [Paenactinomyces guangxiensis]MBH8592620.1 genetic competence negative regulator [Paenactinomyces guangxiensis]
MRVERLGGDKIRFFLTLDDLVDRGIEKDDMWRDIPKVHELFNDMMEHAYQELGFEVVGPVAVEVFALPAQGMVVVVTRGRVPKVEHDDLEPEEDVYELEVTMEETDDIIFRFNDLEDLIQAAMRMTSFIKQGGRVYAYRNGYYLVFGEDLKTDHLETLIAILSEYGEASTTTEPFLKEYGKTIFSINAINQIVKYFG